MRSRFEKNSDNTANPNTQVWDYFASKQSLESVCLTLQKE